MLPERFVYKEKCHHRMLPPPLLPKGGRALKKIWLWGLDFKSGEGSLTISGQILRGARGSKFLERARFSRATMFFCKHVISVATLL